jgi:predicted transporter
MMSEEGSFGLNTAEKFLGLLILVVGGLATYYTFTSMQALENFTGLFGLLSIVLIVAGIVLMTAKTE